MTHALEARSKAESRRLTNFVDRWGVAGCLGKLALATS
jgi:hypothetical protein